jgi:hypothetical protein
MGCTAAVRQAAGQEVTASRRARPNEPLATWCEFQIPAVCTGRAENRHHRKGRGPGLDAPEWTADICHGCHNYAHAHPAESYRMGWMVKRNGAA